MNTVIDGGKKSAEFMLRNDRSIAGKRGFVLNGTMNRKWAEMMQSIRRFVRMRFIGQSLVNKWMIFSAVFRIEVCLFDGLFHLESIWSFKDLSLEVRLLDCR